MTKPETIELAPGVPLELVLVEPGYFIMGSDAEEADYDEKPEHLVHITQPFYIGKYPINQAQWRAVMQDDYPSEFPGPQRPVENVSWLDVLEGNQEKNGAPAFLNRLNELLAEKRPDLFANHQFTLPSEAQWEYAAKGGPRYDRKELEGKTTAALYSTYSGSERLENCGWYGQNSHNETKPVGLKTPNELGLYDMTGNVREWCLDWFDGAEYENRKDPVIEDPVGPESGDYRVVRGVSFWGSARACRVAYRNGYHPTYRNDNVGFRLVLAPSSGSGAAG